MSLLEALRPITGISAVPGARFSSRSTSAPEKSGQGEVQQEGMWPACLRQSETRLARVRFQDREAIAREKRLENRPSPRLILDH